MRSLSGDAIALLSSPILDLAPLVTIDFPSGEQHLTNALRAIVDGGDTYLALGALGRIAPVEDSVGDHKPLTLELAGIQSAQIADALDPTVRGSAVTVALAFVDPADNSVADAVDIWAGAIDQTPLQYGPESSSIQAQCVHRGVIFARARPLRYTDGDQKLVSSGDTGLRFVVSQAQQQDVWPAASYFKK